MGSYRLTMITQFIKIFLSYSGYRNFGIIPYAYCPEYLNVPVTTLRNKNTSHLLNNVAVNATIPGLVEIVRQIRSQMYTRALRYVHSGHVAHQVAVLFVDPSVTVITRKLIEEASRLKEEGVKLYVINVGQNVWSHHHYLHSISSQPYVDYIYSYPTYEQLLYHARYDPLHFKAMCSQYSPNIHLA